MNILSIDPGQDMGFAFWEDNKLLSSHSIKFKGNFEERLKETFLYLMDILEANETELIVIESVEGGGQHWRPLAQLNQIKGLIKCICFFVDLYYEEINQMTVKEITAGSGRADKNTIGLYIKTRFGEEHALNNNQADAVAIGYVRNYLLEHPEIVAELEERKSKRKKKRGKR